MSMNNIILNIKTELKNKDDADKIAMLQNLAQYINRELNILADKVNHPYIERINHDT